MEQKVTIMEDLVALARAKSIRKQYLDQALREGPEVYYRLVLNREMEEQPKKWDLLIMNLLTCLLINELSMKILDEITQNQMQMAITGEVDWGNDASIQLNFMMLEMVNSGRDWASACQMESTKLTKEFTEGTMRGFDFMKSITLHRVENTEQKVLNPMLHLCQFLKGNDMEELCTLYDMVEVQKNAFHKYKGMLLAAPTNLKDPPEWSNQEVIHGAEWVWTEQLHFPPGIGTVVDAAAMVTCSMNILLRIIMDLTDEVTALVTVDDDRLTPDLVQLFTEIIPLCEKFSHTCRNENLNPMNIKDHDRLRGLLSGQVYDMIPILMKIHKKINEGPLQDFFPPNRYIQDRVNDFMKHYLIFQSMA